MPDFNGWLSLIGALCFGLVIGWVTYRTLRRSGSSGLSDIAAVIAAVGGATITALFKAGTGSFGAYCIGLAVGFFAYLRTAADPEAPEWMGGSARPGGSGGRLAPTHRDG